MTLRSKGSFLQTVQAKLQPLQRPFSIPKTSLAPRCPHGPFINPKLSLWGSSSFLSQPDSVPAPLVPNFQGFYVSRVVARIPGSYGLLL